tara:strand:+ start:73 stop:843 length:771 start_codon:yes stop_codon:yes gene_type:complete
MKISITFLGTGTSQGVPVIACDCEVCTSFNFKDQRLRSSVLINIDNKNFVIDTGPDFRHQMLRENITEIEAILFTHKHKDHTAGLDDVRAFNFHLNKEIDVFCDKSVKEALKNEYSYIFSRFKYPGIPRIKINEIKNNVDFSINNIVFKPIQVFHHKLSIFGFRVGDFTYITDAKIIPEAETKKIIGSEILVVNALRIQEHISHFNLKEALNFIEIVKPKKAFLTHISHLMGQHIDVSKYLPKNVYLAYDGLKITL